MSKTCVLGQGYIGLPTALLFANNVYKVDVADTRITPAKKYQASRKGRV